MLLKSNKKASSRSQINIEGVKEDVLLLPNRNYRVVLEVSPINFKLKSDKEQDAITDTFQSFLDSLDVPVQIVMRTRELDMDKYLEHFKSMEKHENQKVYKDQIKNYTSFVKKLIKNNKILSRRFFLVIPQSAKDFESAKEQLNLHTDIVMKGLERMGIHSRRLPGLEILDLFYSFYSPHYAKIQPITSETLNLINKSYFKE